MKKIFWSVALGASLLLSAGAADAKTLELYVRNRPFKGTVVSQAGALHVSLRELLLSLNCTYTVDGNTITVVRGKAAGSPALKGSYVINYEGRNLPVSVSDIKGVSCVDVGAFAKAAGLYYKVNPALGCADLTAQVSKSDVDKNAAAVFAARNSATSDAKTAGGTSSESNSQSGPVTTDGNSPNSPLRLIDMPFSDSTVPGASFAGEVRTYAVIANTGSEDVKNVHISIDVCNYNGDSYHKWETTVPVIKGGETYTYKPDPPMWNNYSYVTCHPKLTITHDPVSEDKEEKAK